MLIGLISDTHGMVRPTVHEALAGVDVILHAGDVGGDAVLDELQLIAPVKAVSGNTDRPGDPRLAPAIEYEAEGIRIHVSHGHEIGSPTPAALLEAYSADVIVYGHTHKQLVTQAADGRWVVNPGAAGARRFNLGPSLARLTVSGATIAVELVDLE